MTTPAAQTMRLYLGELRQLFDSMDPAPFRERDLDPKAAEYIVDSAREAPAGSALALQVQLGREIGDEATGALLQRPDMQQVAGPVSRPVDMSVHDRGRGAQSRRVRRRHHLQPLGGIEFVRAKAGANLVVQDFRRCPRQCVESGRAQAAQKFRDADT